MGVTNLPVRKDWAILDLCVCRTQVIKMVSNICITKTKQNKEMKLLPIEAELQKKVL
jgi:hypothetical protein